MFKKVVQQGHSHFEARSVHLVREHGTMARTPLAALFSIPNKKSNQWHLSSCEVGSKDNGARRTTKSLKSPYQNVVKFFLQHKISPPHSLVPHFNLWYDNFHIFLRAGVAQSVEQRFCNHLEGIAQTPINMGNPPSPPA